MENRAFGFKKDRRVYYAAAGSAEDAARKINEGFGRTDGSGAVVPVVSLGDSSSEESGTVISFGGKE